jgi:nucleoside-diphosphate-sugar epimerase
MATLLVIGGSGFFGKSILDSFVRGQLKRILKVIILSRNATKLATEYPEIINSNVLLIDDDIRSCKKLPFADFIIHAAATTDPQKYISSPDSEFNNLLLSVSNFCNLVREYKINSNILYISSGSVYGNQSLDCQFVDENYSTTNNICDMAINKIPYTNAKRSSEYLIINLGLNNHNVAIARGFSFVGRYLPLNGHFAIGNFIKNGLDKKNIIVNADKFVIRSYMYSDDLVNWLIGILELASTDCEIYNVGSNEAILIDELAIKISKIFNVQVEIKNSNKEFIDRYVPNIDKILKKGFELKYNLDEAIKATINRLN